MPKTLISLFSLCLLAVGCGNNTMDAVVDGDEQSFDEVKLELTRDGDRYTLRAEGLADAGTLTFQMELDKAALEELATGEDHDINGVATFPGIGTAPTPLYAGGTEQVGAVKRIWLEFDCDDCKRTGDEEQRVAGKITFDDVADDHLAGSIAVTIKGGIPFWPTTEAEADIDVEFDLDVPSDEADDEKS